MQYLGFLLLLCCFQAFAVGPQGPAIAKTIAYYSNRTLGTARTSPCICEFGTIALVVSGGTIANAATGTNRVDIFDQTTGLYVNSITVNPARAYPVCASDKVNNKCYILSGGSQTVTVLTVDVSAKTFSAATYADYPVAAIDGVGCYAVGANVYCAGGTTTANVKVNHTYYTNLTAGTWVRHTDLNTPTSYTKASSNAALISNTIIAFCAGEEESVINACHIWNTGTMVLSVVSGYSQHSQNSFVTAVNNPFQKIVIFGGSNGATFPNNLQTSNVNGGIASVTDISNYTSVRNTGVNSAYGLWTLGLFVGGIGTSPSSTGSMDVVHVVDYWQSTSGNFSNYLLQLNVPRTGAGVSAYRNVVYLHGGSDGGSTNLGVEIITFKCNGTSERGFDSWVSNNTYNGCDMVTCNPNYWGSNCDACNCVAPLVCNDTYTGDGRCDCAPNKYGANCSRTCDCAPGQNCSSGVLGDGSCTQGPDTSSAASFQAFFALVVLLLTIVL